MDFRRLILEEKARLRQNTTDQAVKPSTTDPQRAAGQSENPSADSALLGRYSTDCGSCVAKVGFSSSHHKLACPPSVYYIPDAISADDEALLLKATYELPGAWRHLRRRRLQNWGGLPSLPFQPLPLPTWLCALTNSFVDRGYVEEATRINHVLVNEYLPDQGIMAHTDGPMYHNKVVTLSLGESCVIEFRRRSTLDASAGADSDQLDRFTLVLRPRSIVVFEADAYISYTHGIDETLNMVAGSPEAPLVNGEAAHCSQGDLIERTATRVSYTCRHIPADKHA